MKIYIIKRKDDLIINLYWKIFLNLEKAIEEIKNDLELFKSNYFQLGNGCATGIFGKNNTFSYYQTLQICDSEKFVEYYVSEKVINE